MQHTVSRRGAPILATIDSCLPQVVVVGEPGNSDGTLKTGKIPKIGEMRVDLNMEGAKTKQEPCTLPGMVDIQHADSSSEWNVKVSVHAAFLFLRFGQAAIKHARCPATYI